MEDKYSFKGALSHLIRHSLKILSEESVPGAVSAVTGYRARFDSTIEKHEIIHQRYFAEVFKANRDEIMKGYDFDGWLETGDVRVVFGSENPQSSHKGFIPLSDVYRAAKKCVSRAKNSEDQMIIYPQILLLHLYRIFDAIKSVEEFGEHFEGCSQVGDLMKVIEGDLKSGAAGEQSIKSNKLEFPGGVNNLDPAQAINMMMNDPALDSIFKMVTNGFAQSGMLPKEELDKITVNDIRGQFSKMMNSDALKRTFEKMNDTMTNAKSPEEALQATMSILQDKTLVQELAGEKLD
jgi:hypothetical protein